MDDERIIELFFQRNEDAIRYTKEAYGKRLFHLADNITSLLLNSGFTLKDVQEYMGHSDIQMTANIYGHLDTQRKNLLTEKITASIF